MRHAERIEERLAAFPKVKVTSKRNVMGGQPCIEGTRVPAETVLSLINTGKTEFEIRQHFRLPMRAIDGVIDWAREHGRHVSLPLRRMPDTGST